MVVAGADLGIRGIFFHGLGNAEVDEGVVAPAVGLPGVQEQAADEAVTGGEGEEWQLCWSTVDDGVVAAGAGYLVRAFEGETAEDGAVLTVGDGNGGHAAESRGSEGQRRE